MMIMAAAPTTVYLDRSKIDAVVEKLNSDKDDDCKYSVKERVKGRFVIEVVDSAGDFLGYL